MVNTIRKHMALSEQGARDLLKASLACTVTDIALMLPVGVLYMLLTTLSQPLLGGGAAAPKLSTYIGLSAVILLVLFVLNYYQYNKCYLASYQESAEKRISLAEKLRQLPLSFFGQRDLSDLTTTIMGDCAGLETAFSHYIPEFIGAALSIVIVSIGLFAMDWRMAAALLWVVPIAFLITIGGKAHQDKVNAKNIQVQLSRADTIQEFIETAREIKASNQTAKYLAEFDEKLQYGEKVSIQTELHVAMFMVTAQMLLRIGIATVVATGGLLMAKGQLDFMVFLVFLIAASRVFDPLSASLINLAAMFHALLQVERMKKIEAHPVQTGGDDVTYSDYSIRFDHVGFEYNDGETVLQDVSFEAKQGQITALVGPSGGGKSTAAKLAARFWDVTRGKITLGSVDINTVDPEVLLKNFSIVFQDVVLFNNTVMENIRLGRRNATDAEVLAAAKTAQCDEFVRHMPQGYQTVIGENGSTLSGGERQRISIARALLKNAPVILLDEATASLDVENESYIQAALAQLVKNKTVLVIAHRMRTIAGADKIVVLENGGVAEQGTHDQLLAKKGLYNHLWTLQTRAGEWAI